ncbi:MAG: metallophosphoesterase family protein [Chloroflexota bacterium]
MGDRSRRIRRPILGIVLAILALIALGGLALGVRGLPASLATPRPTASFASLAPVGSLGETVTLAGAGDIATCQSDADEATAKLLDGIEGTVFAAGDNAYENGSISDYERCYAPTWGRFKDRTLPAIGNHERQTAGAAGYFAYFGPRAGGNNGWYAVDVGSWRVIVLESDCRDVGGCDRLSRQGRWLADELGGHPARCTLAIWHHPRFSSGEHGDDPQVGGFWSILEDAGAELVINGHDHDYERFAPQDSSGHADADHGIREFVVGTGGKELRGFQRRIDANSEVHDSRSHGVLRLTLRPDGYDWRFVPITTETFTDSGSGVCH